MACHFHNNVHDVPKKLLDRIVPITAAISPGSWYNKLLNYKSAPGLEFSKGVTLPSLLTSVLAIFITTHETSLEKLLGGEIQAIVVVPSSNPSINFGNQVLVNVVRAWPRGDELLLNGLSCIGAGFRNRYAPDLFGPGPDSIDGKRVILVEDTWVTGGTAISAGGALLREGAEEVVILAIGRYLNEAFLKADHEYIRMIKNSNFEIGTWVKS